MDLSLRELAYLGALVGLLLLFRRLRRVFWLFSAAILPGTLCHELCHLCVGTLLNGKPSNFNILPRREQRTYVMGSVAFTHVRWYNAFFLGIAPLLLLPLAYALLAWRLGGHPAFAWQEGLWLYLIANLVYASLPSFQDLRIAARSPIGWLALASAAAYGWFRFQETRPHARPTSQRGLHQVQEPGLARFHAPFGNPGADVGLGQPDQIG